jgi:predicted nucleic acid-binding protein
MLLLISDANILIDMEAGGLIEMLFQLPVQLGIPDVLYYEEIEEGSPVLEQLGLQIMEVSGDYVKYSEQLPNQYNHTLSAKLGAKPSHNDYLALALAKQESCMLLTGDNNLRIVAEKESVTVMGTIGLLCAMVEHQLLNVDDTLNALYKMKDGKRRLPWLEAEKRLEAMR